MIAVLADGDPNGYTFWVAKVIKVITEMRMLRVLKYTGMPQIHTHSMVCISQRW